MAKNTFECSEWLRENYPEEYQLQEWNRAIDMAYGSPYHSAKNELEKVVAICEWEDGQ